MPIKSLEEESTVAELKEKKDTFKNKMDSFPEGEVGDFRIISAEGLETMVDERVREQIRKFFEEKKVIKFREISDIEAKKEIADLILTEKKKGIKTMRAIDIVKRLKLPAYQTEKIIDGFLKEKKLFEI